MSHAVLSPSSAGRWLVCTPSARLEAQEPYSSSVYADEGTLAHRLNELLINYRLGRVLNKKYKKDLAEIEADPLYSGEMWGYCDDFATFVLETYNRIRDQHPDAVLFTEDKVNLTRWVPDGFGTVDIRIVWPGYLHIIDYKHGKGVPVFAEDNKQLKLYSLGAYDEMEMLYPISNVKMTIYQPRIDNISSFEMKAENLLLWAEQELTPLAKMADAGQGQFIAGDHCKFCKIKHKCRALADFNLETARKAFEDPATLSDEETVEILKKAKLFMDWIGSVTDYALAQAVEHGKAWPGMKLVEGLSRRRYSNEDEIASVLIKAGLNSADIYSMKLIGLTDMTKLLGKADFERLLSDYVVKPQGAPVLVPESDKRPAFSSVARAQEAFKDA